MIGDNKENFAEWRHNKVNARWANPTRRQSKAKQSVVRKQAIQENATCHRWNRKDPRAQRSLSYTVNFLIKTVLDTQATLAVTGWESIRRKTNLGLLLLCHQSHAVNFFISRDGQQSINIKLFFLKILPSVSPRAAKAIDTSQVQQDAKLGTCREFRTPKRTLHNERAAIVPYSYSELDRQHHAK